MGEKGKVKRKKAFRLDKKKLAILVVAIFLIIYFSKTAIKIIELKVEQSRLKNESQELRIEKKHLKNELKKVNQAEYIEMKAREQLRLIKPGETLFFTEDEKKMDDSDRKMNEKTEEGASQDEAL